MNLNLIIPVMFLAVFVVLTVTGSQFVTSWKSFLIGILFTLSARDVIKELMRRVEK